MNKVKHKDDIFALPESSYDVAKLTDYYAKATEGSQRILPKEKRRYVMYLRKSTDDEAKQVRSLEQQQQIVTAKETTLAQAESELERVSRALPTEQQFIEIVRSYLETLLKTKDLVEEDLVYREVVLNLRANNDFVSVIKLNPPYNLMVDLEKVPSGRRTDPLNEPVLQTLHSLLLNFGGIQTRLRLLNISLEGLRPKSTTGLQFLL